jgi:hypothetical protein
VGLEQQKDGGDSSAGAGAGDTKLCRYPRGGVAVVCDSGKWLNLLDAWATIGPGAC